MEGGSGDQNRGMGGGSKQTGIPDDFTSGGNTPGCGNRVGKGFDDGPTAGTTQVWFFFQKNRPQTGVPPRGPPKNFF